MRTKGRDCWNVMSRSNGDAFTSALVRVPQKLGSGHGRGRERQDFKIPFEEIPTPLRLRNEWKVGRHEDSRIQDDIRSVWCRDGFIGSPACKAGADITRSTISG